MDYQTDDAYDTASEEPTQQVYQTLFYFRQWPDPKVWLVTSAYAVGAFVVGTTLVLALEDRFAEQL